MAVDLPSKADFDYFDINGDGTLAMDEWETKTAQEAEMDQEEEKAEDAEMENMPMDEEEGKAEE